MLKFLNLIVKCYGWYDKRKCGKEGLCIYRFIGGVWVREYKCLYWKLKLIKCKL